MTELITQLMEAREDRVLLDVLPASGDFLHRLRLSGGLLACRLNDNDTLDGNLKLLGNPGIQALAGNHSGDVDLTVQLRGNSGHELSRKRLLRGLASFVAEFSTVR